MVRSFIPNIITVGNLICGCFAFIMAVESNFVAAALFIFAGAICDFLDGFVARLLKAQSEIGKQLDSLADLVTFGMAPAAIVYQLLNIADFREFLQLPDNSDQTWYYPSVKAYFAFAIVVFTALRLAKFNTDSRQTTFFYGLPSPASGLFFAGIALLFNPFIMEVLPQFPYSVLMEGGVGVAVDMLDYESNPQLLFGYHLINPPFLFALIALFSFLLIAPMPLFSLKIQPGGLKSNRLVFFFLFFCLLLVIVCFSLKILFAALPLIILLYPVVSFFTRKWFVK